MEGVTSKYIPVFFGETISGTIPEPLRGHTWYSFAPYPLKGRGQLIRDVRASPIEIERDTIANAG